MRLLRALILLALLVPAIARGQECRPARTALVLSGGGVKGLAHLGVLRVLDSLEIRPDLIVGTSMGAIIGALYASGFDARQIDSLTRKLPIAEVVRPFRPPSPHPWDRRLPLLFVVRGKRGFEFQTGIVDESQPNARLGAAMLTGNLLARGRFDRLPIPFLAIATDLRDRRTVVLSGGDLARAVRASSAIPLVFPPVPLDGAILVDGGLSANIPILEARAAGAERVIVSDVTEHPQPDLDVESPIELADQLLGFLFQQPEAELRPGDVMIRPEVQGYRSLDFSPESVAEILARGRAAADTTVGRASCLPRGPRPPVPPLPRVLASWSTVSGSPADSALVVRMLRLEAGDSVDAAGLGVRIVDLADAEGLRGVWLNPSGTADSVRFRLEPIRSPTTVGGAGVAYDHELGGRAWVGLFNRRVFGTTLEASGLLSLGRFQRELYGTALWHFDAGWSRVTPNGFLRLRTEDLRQFDGAGQELQAIGTSDARLGAGIELRVRQAWRIRPGADVLVWGAEPLRGEAAVGGSLKVERVARSGVQLSAEGIGTGRFQSVRVSASYPIANRSWSLLPGARLGWGSDDLPLQWTYPLGGDDGFPGLHLGEARGSRELLGSVRFGYSMVGPIQLRLLLAGGRTWSGATATMPVTDWRAGARLGLGADTPIGPMEFGYGFSTGDRRAFYLRLGQWF